jgi:hypothetical protein
MRLPDCSADATPAADPMVPCTQAHHSTQLVAPAAAPTALRAGPRWYPAAACVLALLGVMLLTGCAAVPERLEPLPAALAADASLPGIAGGRYWGDERPAELDAWLAQPEERCASAMAASWATRTIIW